MLTKITGRMVRTKPLRKLYEKIWSWNVLKNFNHFNHCHFFFIDTVTFAGDFAVKELPSKHHQSINFYLLLS